MKKEIATEKRYYWLDLLKIIACFCVIVNHIGSLALTEINPSVSDVLFYCIQFSFCRIGVPLFIMVSGYLYLSSEKSNDFTYKTICKKIFRIIVPLVLLSLLLAIKDTGIKNFNILEFIKNFIKGPYIIPYWYLYMLIGLYMVTPFIKKMLDKFKDIDYKVFLGIFLILPAVVHLLKNGFNIEISNYFFQAFFPVIISYYISGVYISKLKITNKKLIISIILFTIFSVLFFLTVYIPYLKNGAVSYSLSKTKSIFCIFQSLSLFYIFRHFFENKKFNKKLSIFISEISKLTFGIYLTHYLVFYKVYEFAPIHQIFMYNANIGIICIEIIVFVMCGLVTYVMRKIPIIRNFL